MFINALNQKTFLGDQKMKNVRGKYRHVSTHETKTNHGDGIAWICFRNPKKIWVIRRPNWWIDQWKSHPSFKKPRFPQGFSQMCPSFSQPNTTKKKLPPHRSQDLLAVGTEAAGTHRAAGPSDLWPTVVFFWRLWGDVLVRFFWESWLIVWWCFPISGWLFHHVHRFWPILRKRQGKYTGEMREKNRKKRHVC